jgi:NADH-quinone oxidoreductase subunit A
MIGVSYVLGSRHREPATGAPFESGIVTTGTARVATPANFYLVAVRFVIFDLESVFLFAWAVAARQLGGVGYVGACVFIATLVAALAYLWRVGALEGR